MWFAWRKKSCHYKDPNLKPDVCIRIWVLFINFIFASDVYICFFFSNQRRHGSAGERTMCARHQRGIGCPWCIGISASLWSWKIRVSHSHSAYNYENCKFSQLEKTRARDLPIWKELHEVITEGLLSPRPSGVPLAWLIWPNA